MSPKLWILSDVENRPLDAPLLREACVLAAPGSVLLLLRDRNLGDRERMRVGEVLAKIAEDSRQLFGVAGSSEIARLLSASILHLGHRDLGIREARKLLPSIALSVALHEDDEIPEQVNEASFVVLSPFAAPRKGRDAFGIDGYRRISGRVRERGFSGEFVLLGGIDRKIVTKALPEQSVGVAVLGAARSSDELVGIVEALGHLR